MENYPKELSDTVENYDREAWAILKTLTDELDARQPPDIIYHYTDDAGLLGILKSGLLRLTDIFDLNDPSEVRHGFGQAASILTKWAEDKTDDLKGFARYFQNFYAEHGIEQSAHYFVCCFSKNRDELGQWRAYADNGRGFALGFETKALEQLFVKGVGLEDTPATSSTFQVTYDDAKSFELQSKLAELLFPLIPLPAGMEKMHPFVKSRYRQELSVHHAANAISGVLLFKHEAYKTEEEYRFLQLFREDKPVPGIQYKTRPYSLVRYREFDWKTEASSSLKRIVIGPAADKGKSYQFILDCLRAFAPEHIGLQIDPSKIPYRTP